MGVITLQDLLGIAGLQFEGLAHAVDLMRSPAAPSLDDGVRSVFEARPSQGVRELPVTKVDGAIVGFVDQTSIVHGHRSAREQQGQ